VCGAGDLGAGRSARGRRLCGRGDRLRAIATAAQTAAEALDGLGALDLDPERQALLLAALDRLALRLDVAAGRLGAGVDPVRLVG
jgi:hypothetical protein